uniref:DUF1604 domain-containing protein n=1 Tax=Strongyloides venezuelensis TaxID=75913 RepID=A0A0K0FMI2_STRVS
MEIEEHHLEEEVPGPSDERKIQERLIMLQMKLEKARKHKEQYVEYIKNKYPRYKLPKIYREKHDELDFYRINSIDDWKFKRPYGNYESGSYYYTGTRLLEQLETSKYFWDTNKYKMSSSNGKRLKNLDNQIGYGGIILHSEMPMAITRIKEVKADLVNLRNYRLNMGTEEYFRYNNNLNQNADNSLEWDEDRLNKTTNELLELRKQIINLNLDVEDYNENNINQNLKNNVVDKKDVFYDLDNKDNVKSDLEDNDEGRLDEMTNSKKMYNEDKTKSQIDIKKDEEEDNAIIIPKNRTIIFDTNTQSNNNNKSFSEQMESKEKTDENQISSVDEKLKMLFSGNQKKTADTDDSSQNFFSMEKEEDFKSATKTDFLDNLFNKNKKDIKDNKVNITFKKILNDDSDDDFFN